MRLYRPVGLKELRLIFRTGMRAFPPRLPEQSIFYPVLTPEYAQEIAHTWNTRSEDRAGYVTEFGLDDEYAANFEPKIVGARRHREFWVPAEELPVFNSHIRGSITVVAAFFGEGFKGAVPDNFMLKGLSATEQLKALADIFDFAPFDFFFEVRTNAEAVYANYPFWVQGGVASAVVELSRQRKIIDALADVWAEHFPDMPLPRAGKVAA